MYSNGIQGDNGKPNQNELKPILKPNASTRYNFGALKAVAGITKPGKGKDTNY